jgi:hypothetical protein
MTEVSSLLVLSRRIDIMNELMVWAAAAPFLGMIATIAAQQLELTIEGTIYLNVIAFVANAIILLAIKSVFL